MTTVNIYLTFNGNCFEAFNYYRSIFGGDFQFVGRFKEMPPSQDGTIFTGEEGERIMHISLPIGKGTILLGSDTAGESAMHFQQGNNFSISVQNTDSKERTDQLFDQLAKGGQVKMPMGLTFWGDYFGTCTDQFGINWMVAYTNNPSS